MGGNLGLLIIGGIQAEVGMESLVGGTEASLGTGQGGVWKAPILSPVVISLASARLTKCLLRVMKPQASPTLTPLESVQEGRGGPIPCLEQETYGLGWAWGVEEMVERLRDGDSGNRGGRVTWLLYLTMQLWCICVLFVGKLGGYLQLLSVSKVHQELSPGIQGLRDWE